MKFIINFVIVILLTLSAAPLGAQGEPIDLVSLQQAGLSSRSLGRFLAQNLDAERLAPQIEPDFLVSLAAYGGDDLAAAYLELDRATAHLAQRDFSPELISQLMDSQMEPDKLAALLRRQAGVFQKPAASALMEATEAAGASQAEPQPLAPPDSPRPVQPPQAPSLKAAQTVGQAASGAPAAALVEEPPVRRALVQDSPEPPRARPERQGAPLVKAEPAAAASSAPAPAKPLSPRTPQLPPQKLRPGQKADPARPLPGDRGPYERRQARERGPWMGVDQRRLPDGHEVEVHRLGDGSQMGQTVESRPSGAKVQRYYVGQPDDPRSIRSSSEPEQDRQNREQLELILGQ